MHIFLSAHGIFSRIDPIKGEKQASEESRRVKSYQASFLTVMHDTRNQLQKENWKNTNMWRLKTMLLNNQYQNGNQTGN